MRPAWLAGSAGGPPAAELAFDDAEALDAETLDALLDADELALLEADALDDDADALDETELALDELELAGAVVGRTVGAGVGCGVGVASDGLATL